MNYFAYRMALGMSDADLIRHIESEKLKIEPNKVLQYKYIKSLEFVLKLRQRKVS